MAVLNEMGEGRCSPAHVVFVFDSCRQECPKIREVHQSSLTVQVIEESELRSWITKCGEIFNKGDLHLSTWEQHSSMPGELLLLLDEKNFRLRGTIKRSS